MSAMDAKVLRRAAELVEMGHCKHVPSVDEHGAFTVGPQDQAAHGWCLTGAIERAAHELLGVNTRPDCIYRWDYTVDARLFRAMGDALRQVLPDVKSLPDWNNAPERTADEVAAALRAAADRCEASPERSEAVSVNPVQIQVGP